MSTKIARRPISSAFTWYKNAWQLIKSQPMILFTSVLWVLFLSLIVEAAFPYIGPLLSTALTPFFLFGIATIFQHIRLREKVTPLKVFSGFSSKNRKQLALLAFYLAATIFACAMATQFYDGGQFARLFLGLSVDDLKSPSMPELDTSNLPLLQTTLQNHQANIMTWLNEHPHFILAYVSYQLAALLLNILFIYAPFYLALKNTTAATAFKWSLQTLWRNCLPLLLLACLLIVTILFMFIVTAILATLLTVIPFLIILLAPLFFAFFILITALLLASIYSSHYDISNHSQLEASQITTIK